MTRGTRIYAEYLVKKKREKDEAGRLQKGVDQEVELIKKYLDEEEKFIQGDQTKEKKITEDELKRIEEHIKEEATAVLADLLDAFAQDTRNPLYPDRAALLDYCRRSADPIGPVGLVTFTTVNARPALGERATRQFAEQVLGAQSGIEVLGIEPSDSLLRYAADKGDRHWCITQIGGSSTVQRLIRHCMSVMD
jgi:hypothetical protein